jgi:ribosome-associated translation inhibitor RaiA
VELFHEPNRRQAKNCQRVEITGKGRGPVVRAEGCAGDFYAALDTAVGKLEGRLRRMHDRRRVHYGRRAPESVAEATAPALEITATTAAVGVSGGGSDQRRGTAGTAVMEPSAEPVAATVTAGDPVDAENIEVPAQRWDDTSDYEPGRIVREKQHSAEPMTIDQALYQMELVGHDFYLFHDAHAGKPSVVYRRKGFDYGVIRLG